MISSNIFYLCYSFPLEIFHIQALSLNQITTAKINEYISLSRKVPVKLFGAFL
jgi:hypothetical protein